VPTNTRITVEMDVLQIDGVRIYHAERLGMRIVPTSDVGIAGIGDGWLRAQGAVPPECQARGWVGRYLPGRRARTLRWRSVAVVWLARVSASASW
jgi:hypothetical protein